KLFGVSTRQKALEANSPKPTNTLLPHQKKKGQNPTNFPPPPPFSSPPPHPPPPLPPPPPPPLFPLFSKQQQTKTKQTPLPPSPLQPPK
ncbi:hypothetical protein, partial [Enterococcus faecalis]|uniref:hypothetical protein n=1 Tax=Enterococcus faecalis TaxID=1351 RepID=UPI003D6BF449